MKTTARTTLPDNPHEQPIYEWKRSRVPVYYFAIILLFVNGSLWGLIPFPELIKAGAPGMVLLVIPVIFLLLSIICMLMVSVSTRGDVYFYEQYAESRGLFLPFVKQNIIYYDKMHVHILKEPDWIMEMKPVSGTLSYYETPPKLWSYIRLRAYHSENIGFSLALNSEVMEFIKTKAQSVSYYKFMW